MSDNACEDQLDQILATVDQWHDGFAGSPEYAGLSKPQQREARAITGFFARYIRTHLGLAPGEWTGGAVWECCTEILPEKVCAESDFFEALAPVLSAFFKFMERCSLLANGRALATVAASAHEDIVANAGNQINWGPAKRFVMAAMDAGVDVYDPRALDHYVAQYHTRHRAQLQHADSGRSLWPTFAGSSAAVKAIFQPPDNRYDACPCGSGRKYKYCCGQYG